MKKLTVLFIIILFAVPGTAYAGYSVSDWAQKAVAAAENAEILPDGLDGDLARDITRLDFCRIAIKTFEKCKEVEEVPVDGTFTDTDSADVYALSAMGIISGRGNGVFAPQDRITREEAALILSRMAEQLNIEPANRTIEFSDMPEGNGADSVKKIVSLGIMRGMGDGKFAPGEGLSIEQTAIAMLRILERAESEQIVKYELAEGLIGCKVSNSIWVDDNGRIILAENADDYKDFDDVYAMYGRNYDEEFIFIIDKQNNVSDDVYSTRIYSRSAPETKPFEIDDQVIKMIGDCYVTRHSYVGHAISMGEDRYPIVPEYTVYEPDGAKITYCDGTVIDICEIEGSGYAFINGNEKSILFKDGKRIEEGNVLYNTGIGDSYQKKDNDTGLCQLIGFDGNVILESYTWITSQQIGGAELVKLMSQDGLYTYSLYDGDLNKIKDVGTFEGTVIAQEFSKNIRLQERTESKNKGHYYDYTYYIYDKDWNKIKDMGTSYEPITTFEFDGGIIAAENNRGYRYDYYLYDNEWNRIKTIGTYSHSQFDFYKWEYNGETRRIITVINHSYSVRTSHVYDADFNELWSAESSYFKSESLENNMLITHSRADGELLELRYNMDGEIIQAIKEETE